MIGVHWMQIFLHLGYTDRTRSLLASKLYWWVFCWGWGKVQCCGSASLWCGSGCRSGSDLSLWCGCWSRSWFLVDADPDPAHHPDADADPGYQNYADPYTDADPDPQQWVNVRKNCDILYFGESTMRTAVYRPWKRFTGTIQTCFQ